MPKQELVDQLKWALSQCVEIVTDGATSEITPAQQQDILDALVVALSDHAMPKQEVMAAFERLGH